MDKGRVDLMHSLKGMSNKRMLKSVPRKEKKHFNMIELLKAEEKKKKGGIGVATKGKPSEQQREKEAATKTVSPPTASQLLAVKLRKKENISKPAQMETATKKVVPEGPNVPIRCSTTDEELEALFSAIDKEITEDPEAALDLLDIIEDNPDDITEEMQEEIEVIKSNIYLPPEDDYEMDVEEEKEEKEDEEMKEMMAMIESAKEEFDSVKDDELIKIMDKLDDDEYFDKLKKDVKKTELEKLQTSQVRSVVVEDSKLDEDTNKNKRRADEEVPEKEPSKKKTKDNKKKKAVAVGGVSMFGGKDLFGGKNPFASRKQEVSSEEEEEEGEEMESEDPRQSDNVSSNGHPPPPPPPPTLPSFNIAVQADSEEQPVSFDDLPSSGHLISSTNKHRAKVPTRRRPTGKIGRQSNGHQSEGSATNGNGQDRLALPSEENDYDGDESEMSYSQIKRGHRRSLKRRPQPQPQKSSTSLIPGNRISDSDNDKELVHSKNCDANQLEKEKQDKLAREKAKVEEDRRLESERIAREKAEEARLAKEMKFKADQEEEAKRLEAERVEKQRAEDDRIRKERRGETLDDLPALETHECKVCNVSVKYIREVRPNAL